jgi:hypothetical protein
MHHLDGVPAAREAAAMVRLMLKSGVCSVGARTSLQLMVIRVLRHNIHLRLPGTLIPGIHDWI